MRRVPFLQWAASVLISAVFPILQAHAAATLTIVPGQGFNDSTAAAPVGGNTGTTVGAQRLIAFQHAANIWGQRINSPVEIRVSANFVPLECSNSSGVLGAAGPTTVHRDFPGAPLAGTWYVQALANGLFGGDLSAGDEDIDAVFNSNIGSPGCLQTSGWYYGLDGNTPAGKIDFVTVLVHEFGHGLGFLSLVSLS
ncbi:MAG: peptidase, partial [Deltaproteobacteria bacterium]|nr:peptidase [Deltaproteobacteria bacterium]